MWSFFAMRIDNTLGLYSEHRRQAIYESSFGKIPGTDRPGKRESSLILVRSDQKGNVGAYVGSQFAGVGGQILAVNNRGKQPPTRSAFRN